MSSRKHYEVTFADVRGVCVFSVGGGKRHRRPTCCHAERDGGPCRADQCPVVRAGGWDGKWASAKVSDAPAKRDGLLCWVWGGNKSRADTVYIQTSDGRRWNNTGRTNRPCADKWMRGGNWYRDYDWREFPASELARRVRAIGGDPNARPA